MGRAKTFSGNGWAMIFFIALREREAWELE
jgi:hypothetical protein